MILPVCLLSTEIHLFRPIQLIVDVDLIFLHPDPGHGNRHAVGFGLNHGVVQGFSIQDDFDPEGIIPVFGQGNGHIPADLGGLGGLRRRLRGRFGRLGAGGHIKNDLLCHIVFRSGGHGLAQDGILLRLVFLDLDLIIAEARSGEQIDGLLLGGPLHLGHT